MPGGFRDAGGFTRTLTASVILHAAIIAAAASMHRPVETRYISPAYTTVSIIEEPAPVAPPSTGQGGKVQVPAPPPKREAVKKIRKPPAGAAKGANAADVDLALRKIEKNVKKKTEADMLASRVDAIKKRRERRTDNAGAAASGAVEDIKRRVGAEGAARDAVARPAGTKAGQQGPAGAGQGMTRDALDARYHAYYGLIRDRVQENWKYPYKDDKVTIIVSIRIGKTGELMDARIAESSGNSLFDESLLGAIKKAAPFPGLPQGFLDNYLDAELRFCPGCAQ